MQVGRFYLRHNNFLAAINRFKVVVTDYQTTAQVEEALGRLTEAYTALGIIPEAQTAAAVLGYNYPDSKWYKTLLRTLAKVRLKTANARRVVDHQDLEGRRQASLTRASCYPLCRSATSF